MCTKIKREIIVVWSCHAPLRCFYSHQPCGKTKQKQTSVCLLSHILVRDRRPACRARPVVFAWLRPECSSADQIHTEEDEEEARGESAGSGLGLAPLKKNASVLLCDSLRRHFVKDEKQTRKHNNETVPKQNAASTLQNKQTKKKKHEPRARTVYVLYVGVGGFLFSWLHHGFCREKKKRNAALTCQKEALHWPPVTPLLSFDSFLKGVTPWLVA